MYHRGDPYVAELQPRLGGGNDPRLLPDNKKTLIRFRFDLSQGRHDQAGISSHGRRDARGGGAVLLQPF